MDESKGEIENPSESENMTKKRSGATIMSVIGYPVAGGWVLFSYYCSQKGLIPAAYVALGASIVTAVATLYFTNELRKLEKKSELKNLEEKIGNEENK